MQLLYRVFRIKNLKFEYISEFQDFGDGIVSLSFTENEEHAGEWDKQLACNIAEIIKGHINSPTLPTIQHQMYGKTNRIKGAGANESWTKRYDNY